MTDPRGAPLKVLRKAVLEAAAADSYRAVARKAKLSARAVQMFATGTTVAPRERTVRHLRRWYARLVAGREEEVVAVVESLLATLPAPAHAEGARAIAHTVSALHRKHGVEVPAWANALSAPPFEEETMLVRRTASGSAFRATGPSLAREWSAPAVISLRGRDLRILGALHR